MKNKNLQSALNKMHATAPQRISFNEMEQLNSSEADLVRGGIDTVCQTKVKVCQGKTTTCTGFTVNQCTFNWW